VHLTYILNTLMESLARLRSGGTFAGAAAEFELGLLVEAFIAPWTGCAECRASSLWTASVASTRSF
jgi:hypothetical protein